jgi:GNAT superfamily N-acetyltransferase
MTEVRLRALGPEEAEACDAIIAGLPYHFAQEQGRLDCAAAVRRDAGLVATEAAQVVGFLTYVHRFDEAAEITWMAVRADRRRRGIGHGSIEKLAEQLAPKGDASCWCSRSPNDQGPEPDDGYQSTRAFYRATGFALGRDLRGEWDADTAVLMVRALAR